MSPYNNVDQQYTDPPDSQQPQKIETVCSCCGVRFKSGISLIEAQRFQRVYRQQVDEFLHGPHI